MDLRRQNIAGADYTLTDVSGWIFAHCDLTGCKFGKAVGANFTMCDGENIDFSRSDLSGSTFEKSSESVLQCLVGATWNGQTVSRISNWLVQSNPYWCFATDVFVQIGCMQKTWAQWLDIGTSRESLSVLHEEQPRIDLDATWQWWNEHRQTIQDWIGGP